MIAPASRNLGKYEIRQKLGRGGMADVYLAFDTVLNHTVALKLIEHSEDVDTRDSIEAERRGAELQAHLAEVDAHVVKIYDAGDIDGFFYVAMEYIEGQDLAELMRKGPLEPGFAADVAIAVANTLENAHTLHAVTVEGKEFHGIVHGDIKPKNIRIDTDSGVRVLDFGIAKALSLSRRLTRNEFGSVPYASPERLTEGQVDAQSDLWSLAVMLYEMVSGLQPYQAATTERLEKMIRSLVPPPPAPDPCPDQLRRILVKAMMPEPELRYANAREFADDLIMFRTGGPVRAVSEDLEATRRTLRRADTGTRRDTTRQTGPHRPDDDTRRTADVKQADEVISWPPARPKPKRPPLPPLVRRIAVVALGCCLLLALLSAISTIVEYRQGEAFARQIQTEQVTDLNSIWTRWTELSRDNPSSILLRDPRKAVKQRMVEAADRVIASYRNSDAVYENGWKAAHDDLAHALALDPDETVRGKLRLTEGHLARIDGTTHHSPAELNDAVEKFTEAEHLLPSSPDPELGLARVYVYGLKDIDKADQALHRAEQRGFTIGSREKSQLADGYRERADRLFWDSRNVRGLPQEKDQIERARDDYQHALELYQRIAPWGNANTSITRVQDSLESVNFRLAEIEKGGGTAKDVGGAFDKLRKLLHLWQ